MRKDNRGVHMTVASQRNRYMVWLFYMADPSASVKDAADHLHLSHPTICTHRRAIRQGWRPEGYSGDPPKNLQ